MLNYFKQHIAREYFVSPMSIAGAEIFIELFYKLIISIEFVDFQLQIFGLIFSTLATYFLITCGDYEFLKVRDKRKGNLNANLRYCGLDRKLVKRY